MCTIVKFEGRHAFLHPDFILPNGSSVTKMYWIQMVSGKTNKQILARIATPAGVRRAASFMPKIRGYDKRQYDEMAKFTHWKFTEYVELRHGLISTWPDKLVNGVNERGDKFWGAQLVSEYPFWIGENKAGLIVARERNIWLNPPQ